MFRLEGQCTRCGACCRTLVSTWYMTGYDPRDLDRPNGCRFLLDAPDGATVCRIRSGQVPWLRLSANVRRYYLANCVRYPDPTDPGHRPPRHRLPDGCGYRLVEVG